MLNVVSWPWYFNLTILEFDAVAVKAFLLDVTSVSPSKNERLLISTASSP